MTNKETTMELNFKRNADRIIFNNLSQNEREAFLAKAETLTCANMPCSKEFLPHIVIRMENSYLVTPEFEDHDLCPACLLKNEC